MINQSKMEQKVFDFIRKDPDEHGVIKISNEEKQAIVQMIYATYNKVNQLCSAMYRQQHVRNSGVPDNSHPWL